MLINEPCVVSLTWKLADGQGQPIDELVDPMEFFFGGGDLLAGIEVALAGQAEGFETLVHLEPEQAFGEYLPELVCFEQRTLFPDGVEEGMQFDGLPEGAQTPGMPGDVIYTITGVYPEHIVLDGNHPLAGMALRLQVRVVAVRQASEEEMRLRSVVEEADMVSIAPSPSDRLH